MFRYIGKNHHLPLLCNALRAPSDLGGTELSPAFRSSCDLEFFALRAACAKIIAIARIGVIGFDVADMTEVLG
jgi:hypothetical protein